MCGGRLVHLPCSHLGHIPRSQPYSFPGGRRRVEVYNYKRAVEVWVDPEYRSFIYDHFEEMKVIKFILTKTLLDYDRWVPNNSRSDQTSVRWQPISRSDRTSVRVLTNWTQSLTERLQDDNRYVPNNSWSDKVNRSDSNLFLSIRYNELSALGSRTCCVNVKDYNWDCKDLVKKAFDRKQLIDMLDRLLQDMIKSEQACPVDKISNIIFFIALRSSF